MWEGMHCTTEPLLPSSFVVQASGIGKKGIRLGMSFCLIKIKHKISFINMVSRKIKQEERGGLLSGSYMVNYNLGC